MGSGGAGSDLIYVEGVVIGAGRAIKTKAVLQAGIEPATSGS